MNPLPTKPNRWRPITVFNLLVGLLFSLSALAQPAFLKDGLVAYYPFNGNANGIGSADLDFSTSNLQFIDGNSGTPKDAVLFNGTTALSTESSAGFLNIFGVQKESSVSLWIKPDGKSNNQCIVTKGFISDNAGLGNRYFIISYVNGGVSFNLYNFQQNNYIYVPPSIITTNSWQHLVVVRSIIWKIYLDGKDITNLCQNDLINQGWSTDYNLVLDGAPLTVGAYNFRTSSTQFNYQNYYTGSLTKLRFYSRGLSSDEVKALYDYESTPPDNSFITNGLVAYYPFNGNANDESGNQYHGVVEDIEYDFSVNEKQSSSAYFNGASSFIKLPETLGNVLAGSNPISVSCWVYCENQSDYNKVIIQIGPPISNSAFALFLSGGVGGPTGAFAYSEWGYDYDLFNNAPLTLKKWHHCVAVLDTQSKISIYVDGVPCKSRSVVSNRGKSAPMIGRNNNPQSVFFGRMDNVRIYSRALSDTEVTALYDYESIPQSINPRTATATAQVVNGFVVGATITDGGYGYVSNPVVAIIGGGGTGAKATATQFNGVVTSITITNPGSGYTSTPTITIAPPPFPPRKATSTAQIVNGFVVGTKITDGGFGYDSPPAVLVVGGGGSGATAVATVANGVVTAITITNPGTGYTSAPLVRIASPPFTPKLAIETSKVYVRMSVVLGRKYQLEASTDLNTWTTTGPAFIAQDEELAQEFDVNQVGRYFRINQVP